MEHDYVKFPGREINRREAALSKEHWFLVVAITELYADMLAVLSFDDPKTNTWFNPIRQHAERSVVLDETTQSIWEMFILEQWVPETLNIYQFFSPVRIWLGQNLKIGSMSLSEKQAFFEKFRASIETFLMLPDSQLLTSPIETNKKLIEILSLQLNQ